MAIDTTELDGLIGRIVEFRGQQLSIVDVLPERPAIVLAPAAGEHRIQGNQFGEAARRAPPHLTLDLTDSHGEPHPLMRELTLL